MSKEQIALLIKLRQLGPTRDNIGICYHGIDILVNNIAAFSEFPLHEMAGAGCLQEIFKGMGKRLQRRAVVCNDKLNVGRSPALKQ